MMTRQEFIDHLGKALYHLYEPDRLSQNPLAALFGVARRPDAFGALQKILVAAIASLEPPPDEPPISPAWQLYEPLYHRFVQQLDQEQVAPQLGMSVRHLRRKEHAAVEALAAYLWQKHGLELSDQTRAPDGEPADDLDHSTGPSVAEELAWLHEVPPERPVELAGLLRSALELIEPLAAHHGVRLTLDASPDLPVLPVHEVALSQALLNLLSAAIPLAATAEVRVSVLPQAELVEIRVACLSAGHPGNRPVPGRSLHVAEQLAELCGGSLQADMADEGWLARLLLPVVGPVPVLVIDDNADTLQLVRRYAVGSRYRLATVQDGDQALRLVGELRPHIIVLDVMMPHVDGWRLLMQLRQHPDAVQTPVVICTILPQQEMALVLGANGFLQKPFTRQAFLAALDAQLRSPETGSH